MNKKHPCSSLKVSPLPIAKETCYENSCLLFPDGCTPLHFSSTYGHADVCKQLISAKASIDATKKVSLWMLVVIYQYYSAPLGDSDREQQKENTFLLG